MFLGGYLIHLLGSMVFFRSHCTYSSSKYIFPCYLNLPQPLCEMRVFYIKEQRFSYWIALALIVCLHVIFAGVLCYIFPSWWKYILLDLFYYLQLCSLVFLSLFRMNGLPVGWYVDTQKHTGTPFCVDSNSISFNEIERVIGRLLVLIQKRDKLLMSFLVIGLVCLASIWLYMSICLRRCLESCNKELGKVYKIHDAYWISLKINLSSTRRRTRALASRLRVPFIFKVSSVL